MASSSSSPFFLGWYSIIETLADLKQAELSLLQGLINRVPDFYTAAPESTRERVALRYLEEYASRGIVNTKGLSGGAIGISQSTEEFLCQNLTRLNESDSGAGTKLLSITEDVPASSHRQGKNIVDEEHEISHYEEDNILVEEDKMIGDPRSAGWVESMHTDTSENLPSQNALDADKTASEPLQENIPTTVTGNVSNLEAARTEHSSDNMTQFILKRRDAMERTSVEELEKPIPEKCTRTLPSRNDNKKKSRQNANLLDHPGDSESYFMESLMPFSEQHQCIICNKEGQLLACSRKGCGMTVHESCIMTAPSSFNKEGWFYCPCCASARAAHALLRAKSALSLAKESLSSFLKVDQNQEKGEKGKQLVETNINGKRKGKRAEFSDNTTGDEDGDDTLAGFSGDASRSRKGAKNDGKTREKPVGFNDRNLSEERDMLHGRVKEAKKHKADLAFARLDKYIYVKSGPGATSMNHEVVSMNEKEAGNKRREDADISRRHRPVPRYSNKAVAPHRHNMLPWSAEEEQALREGVQKHGVTSDGRIPWSTILVYGRNVFHQTRLPVDLKDKWRNMMKKEG